MGLVTRGVASVVEKHLAIGITLRLLGSHETVVLSGIDIVDESLLRLEVERHRIRLVRIVTHLEDRQSVLLSRRVLRTHSMYQAGVH